MIGTSTAEYVFIRICIILLRAVTPLSILYWLARFLHPGALHVPVILDVWTAAEVAFYVLFYIPRKRHLQKAAIHPPPPTRQQRRGLFSRCSANIPDYERYLRGWFMGAPLSEIKRENLREFLSWAFLNTADLHVMSEGEFDEYIHDAEEQLGRKIESGKGNAKCLRLTLDRVIMSHRCLIWYLAVFVVDAIASARLSYYGFDFHRTHRRHWFSVLPPRPQNLLAKSTSPSRTITYWHRPHTAKTKLPILFLHGIGIGLYPYVDFLSEINNSGASYSEDEGVGIIAIEIMPISFRITSPALRRDQMCAEIDRILKVHGWDRFVLVSHSYGSVITTHMLHSPEIASKIGPVLLIDPVTFLLHIPDVAYNFIIRKPSGANEHQLSYFASRDMGVAHTLSRCFFWNENILWKEDLTDRKVTVVLSERDLIVDTKTVRAYLAGEGKWESTLQASNNPDILWFEGIDHAQVFDKSVDRKRLIGVLRRYCNKS